MADQPEQPGEGAAETPLPVHPLDEAGISFDMTLLVLVAELRAQFPTAPPYAVMAMVAGRMVRDFEAMVPAGMESARTALVLALEESYEEPTSFIQRNAFKDQLAQFSEARRKATGKRPGLIIPPGAG